MILGITGSFGAGKGVAVDYLVKEKGFFHYSARAFIVKEIERRGLPVDRDSMRVVSNSLREQHGATYIIASLFEEALRQGKNAVIESVRSVPEVQLIKEKKGFVLGIDADVHTRYERIVLRGSETDGVTFEEWAEQERAETNAGDPTKQDIFGALRASDEVIMNEGTPEELHRKIDAFLAQHTT